MGEKITDPLADTEGTPDPAKDRRGFNYTLRIQYRKWRDIPVRDFILRQDETKAHNNVARWRIRRVDGGDGGSGGTDQTGPLYVNAPEDMAASRRCKSSLVHAGLATWSSLSADLLHALWLGKESTHKAFYTGRIRTSGNLLKAMQLGEVFQEAERIYPTVARKYGLDGA